MQCNNVYDSIFMRDIQIERMSIGFTNLNAGDGYAVIFVGSPFFTEEFQVSRYVVIGKCVGCVIMVAGKIQIINIGCAPHSVKDFVYRSNLYALSVKHISCQNDRADIVFCGIFCKSEK